MFVSIFSWRRDTGHMAPIKHREGFKRSEKESSENRAGIIKTLHFDVRRLGAIVLEQRTEHSFELICK